MAAAAQSRPEPMNATPHHTKVRVSLTLSDPLFVAGQHLSGKMQMECRADKGLGIGVIMLELLAIQELTSRDHSATSTFIHLTRRFQGPGLPPSNAVHPQPLPESEPLPPHHHPARKGSTTFFFRFPLPASAPSNIDFGKGLAKLRYEVRASVGVGWKGERRLVTGKTDVNVVEAFDEVACESGQKVIVGENGKIWAHGLIVNRILVSGQSACVELHVKNHSAKKTSSLTLSLKRNLHLPGLSATPNTPRALEISDTLVTLSFRGPEYIVHPGTEGVANLVFNVPKTARGLRGGLLDSGDDDEFDQGSRRPIESLFEVKCVVSVTIGMGLGSRDVILDIPVTIAHPASLPHGPPMDLYPKQTGYPNVHDVNDPLVAPQPYFQHTANSHEPAAFLSASTTPFHDSPYIYSTPSPMYQHSPPSEHPWSPWSPPPQPVGYVSPPIIHPNIPEPRYYFPPQRPATHISPTRPISADPYAAQQLPSLPRPSAVMVSGLPPTTPTSPPFVFAPALNTAVMEQSEGPTTGVVGKGERASRISAHLRQSSRNRSASPQSHCFPFPAQAPVLSPITVPPPMTVSPAPALLAVSPVRSVHSNAGVLSPRPMLSPKHSVVPDLAVPGKGIFAMCDHVEELERIAAEEPTHTFSQGRDINIDKTLPAPPVPSRKDRIAATAAALPRADEIFDAPQDDGTPKMPPQPMLAPVTPGRRARQEPMFSVSGLELLEQKLLEQVGTRRLDVEGERKPDVRGLLPINIPHLERRETVQTDDSAISSLALAEMPSEDNMRQPTHTLSEPGPEALKPEFKEEPQKRERDNARGERRRENAKHSEAQQIRKAATGRVAAWLGGIDPNAPPPPVDTPLGVSPKSPVREFWSAVGDHSPHPLLRSAQEPKSAPQDNSQRERVQLKTSNIPAQSSGFVLHAVVNGDSPVEELVERSQADGARDTQPDLAEGYSSTTPPVGPSTEPDATPQDDAPSPQLPVEGRPRQHLRLPAFPLARPLDPEVGYDVRSARGGRGGKVASVAAMWASVAQPENKKDRPKPHSGSKPAILQAKFLKAASAPGKSGVHSDKSALSQGEGTRPRRAMWVKSASVPAVVSSSLATPVLSSTASLARPSSSSSPGTPRLPATIAEEMDNSQLPRPARGEMIFGQAKLKDLIKKYQQG